MKLVPMLSIATFLSLLSLQSFANVNAASPRADGCEFIRQAIAQAHAGAIIQIPAGTFNCEKAIVLDKSNMTLTGAGIDKTTLRLADQHHAPVVVIGSVHTIARDGKLVTPFQTRNVSLMNLTIDGNLANHDPSKECGETHCDGDATSIRNNALSVRGSEDIRIENVRSHHSISGGLVTEKFCKRLTVVNFESYGNFFDGFAGYETEDSRFINSNLHNNNGAGISIDIRFNNNHFIGGQIVENRNIGVFARDLDGNSFENILFDKNGDDGGRKWDFFFASSVANDLRFCASNNRMINIQSRSATDATIRINDGCPGNQVINSELSGSQENCVSAVPGTWSADSSSTCNGEKLNLK